MSTDLNKIAADNMVVVLQHPKKMKIDRVVNVRNFGTEKSQFLTLYPKVRKLDDCADLGRIPSDSNLH